MIFKQNENDILATVLLKLLYFRGHVLTRTYKHLLKFNYSGVRITLEIHPCKGVFIKVRVVDFIDLPIKNI